MKLYKLVHTLSGITLHGVAFTSDKVKGTQHYKRLILEDEKDVAEALENDETVYPMAAINWGIWYAPVATWKEADKTILKTSDDFDIVDVDNGTDLRTLDSGSQGTA